MLIEWFNFALNCKLSFNICFWLMAHECVLTIHAKWLFFFFLLLLGQPVFTPHAQVVLERSNSITITAGLHSHWWWICRIMKLWLYAENKMILGLLHLMFLLIMTIHYKKIIWGRPLIFMTNLIFVKSNSWEDVDHIYIQIIMNLLRMEHETQNVAFYCLACIIWPPWVIGWVVYFSGLCCFIINYFVIDCL